MLFVSINTWEPSATKEIQKRVIEEGLQIPEGMELVAFYVDLGGGRSFSVFETVDPKAIAIAAMLWADVQNMEVVPVVEEMKDIRH